MEVEQIAGELHFLCFAVGIVLHVYWMKTRGNRDMQQVDSNASERTTAEGVQYQREPSVRRCSFPPVTFRRRINSYIVWDQ